jgi:hypothetical protein
VKLSRRVPWRKHGWMWIHNNFVSIYNYKQISKILL